MMKIIALFYLLFWSLPSFSQVAVARNKNYTREKADSLLQIIDSNCKEINGYFKSSKLHEKGKIIAYHSDSVRRLEKIEVYSKTDSSRRVQYFIKNSVIFKMGKVHIDGEWVDFDYYYLDNGVVFQKRRNGDLDIGMEESAFLKQGYFYANKFKSK